MIIRTRRAIATVNDFINVCQAGIALHELGPDLRSAILSLEESTNE